MSGRFFIDRVVKWGVGVEHSLVLGLSGEGIFIHNCMEVYLFS